MKFKRTIEFEFIALLGQLLHVILPPACRPTLPLWQPQHLARSLHHRPPFGNPDGAGSKDTENTVGTLNFLY